MDENGYKEKLELFITTRFGKDMKECMIELFRYRQTQLSEMIQKVWELKGSVS